VLTRNVAQARHPERHLPQRDRRIARVTHVDTSSVLADAQGSFSAYLPDPQGRLELVRESDGEHLTAAGGDRVA